MAALKLLGAPDENIGNPTKEQDISRSIQLQLPYHVIEELTSCSDSGKLLQLSLGSIPLLRFGDSARSLQISHANFRLELYKEQPNDQHNFAFDSLISHQAVLAEAREDTAGAENALATLQATLAQYNRDKQDNSAEFLRNDTNNPNRDQANNVNGSVVNGKNNKKNSWKRPPLFQNVSRSMPTSPSLPPQSKPLPSSKLPQSQAQNSTIPPTSAPNHSLSQSASKLQAQRFSLFHFLALGPASEDSISKATAIPKEELGALLDKVAKPSTSGSRQWELSDRWFTDLQVWSFHYQSSEDRQKAVDNAIRAFDRRRISREDKLWQSLLPKDQRGKGIVLSKLNLSTNKSSAPKNLNHKEAPSSGGHTQSSAPSEDKMTPGKSAEKGPSNSTQRLPQSPPESNTTLDSAQGDQVTRKRKSSLETEQGVVKRQSDSDEALKSTKQTRGESHTTNHKPKQASQENLGGAKPKSNSNNNKIKSAEFIEDSDELLEEDTIEQGDKKRIKTAQDGANAASKTSAAKNAASSSGVKASTTMAKPASSDVSDTKTAKAGKMSSSNIASSNAQSSSSSMRSGQTLNSPSSRDKDSIKIGDSGSRSRVNSASGEQLAAQPLNPSAAKTHRHTQSLPTNSSITRPTQPANSLKRATDDRDQPQTPSKKAKPNGQNSQATRNGTSSSPLTNVSDLPSISPPSKLKESPSQSEQPTQKRLSRSVSLSDEPTGHRLSSSSNGRSQLEASPKATKMSPPNSSTGKSENGALLKELQKEYNDRFSKHIKLQFSLDQMPQGAPRDDTEYYANYKELQCRKSTIKLLMRRAGQDDSTFPTIPRNFKASSVPGLVDYMEKKILGLRKKLKLEKERLDLANLTEDKKRELWDIRDEINDLKALRDN